MAAAAVPSVTWSATAGTVVSSPRRKAPPKITYIKGLDLYSGVRTENCLTNLGKPLSSERAFAKMARSLTSGRCGGAMSSIRCSAAAEIFRIAAIMNGLVLVGVAVGFVLLRIEAYVEETESE